jgi:DNA repair exonuclease SbcCD ATPase subunit
MFDCNTKEVMKNIHLVNDNKDKAAIILEVMANGERYTIQREIERIKFARKGEAKEWGKTILDFVRHDKDGGVEKLVCESRPDTEKQIRRRFGSFEDFMLTSLFAQWDPMDLIMCKETDRKRILFRFLDLDIFEEKAKIAKEESKEWLAKLADLEDNNYEAMRDQLKQDQVFDEEEMTTLDIRHGVQEDKVAELHNKIEELARSIIPVTLAYQKVEANSIVGMEASLVEAKENLERLERIAAENQTTVDWKRDALKEYNEEYIDKQIAKLEELEAALSTIQSSVKDHQRHVDDRKKQIELLDRVPCGDKFPSCQFLVNAFKAKEELPDHLKDVIDLELEAQTLRGEIVKLEPYREQKDAYSAKMRELEKDVGTLKFCLLKVENGKLIVGKLEAEIAQAKLELERYEQVKRDLEKNEIIQHEIGEKKEELAQAEKGLKVWETKIAELHRKMGSREADLERLEKAISQVKDVKDRVTAFEHFANAMGKDGIALQVLKQKLPIINEEINKILGVAAEFGVYIEYDNEDQSIRLYLQYGQYKSRLLELGSGAEKFLASVAIRSALLSISNLPRSNMFIIDEGFGKLDPQNLEAVSRMFDYLKTAFDHVLVISHSELMKDMVDNMIDINQDDEGYAHVEIGG